MRALKAIMDQNPSQIQPKSNQIQIKSSQIQPKSNPNPNQNQIKIQPKASQIQIQIKSKSKSNQNPSKSKIEIESKSKSNRKSLKSQEILWKSKSQEVLGLPSQFLLYCAVLYSTVLHCTVLPGGSSAPIPLAVAPGTSERSERGWRRELRRKSQDSRISMGFPQDLLGFLRISY